MPALNWNTAEVEQLTNLFQEGLSFSLIARRIDRKSKNACVGKAKRLGLPQRGKIIACERMSSKPKVFHVKQEIPSRPGKTVKIVDSRCSILDLRDCSCRFPLWTMESSETDRYYCGQPTACLSEGRPYCPQHAEIVHTTR